MAMHSMQSCMLHPKKIVRFHSLEKITLSLSTKNQKASVRVVLNFKHPFVCNNM